MKSMISPSMMCVDFKHLEDNVKLLTQLEVEYLHFDIMDGEFVPNYTLGPDFMRVVRSISDIPFDIHLMVQRPAQIYLWQEHQACLYLAQTYMQPVKSCGKSLPENKETIWHTSDWM